MRKWHKIGIFACISVAVAAILLNLRDILIWFAAALVVTLAFIGSLFEPAEKTVPLSYVSEELALDLSAGTVEKDTDTHGGFLGDGETVVVITFSPEDAPKIGTESGWRSLPLTENLTATVYGGYVCGTGVDSLYRAPFFEDENGEPVLPPVENGYYLFTDRSSEATDPTDDNALYSRASYNFTLAIYDTDTHTLYYFELDT